MGLGFNSPVALVQGGPGEEVCSPCLDYSTRWSARLEIKYASWVSFPHPRGDGPMREPGATQYERFPHTRGDGPAASLLAILIAGFSLHPQLFIGKHHPTIERLRR